MLKKPAAINTPETPNVQGLYRDRVTSHGKAAKVEATVVPSPARTSKDGSAQQSKVPTELKSEK